VSDLEPLRAVRVRARAKDVRSGEGDGHPRRS
jgi:hypothetical protein